MKILLSLIITLITVALILYKPTRKHLGKVLCGYFVMVIVLFAFYNYRTAGYILKFIRPVNQMFYQPDFQESGEYPDALLPYILEGKKIYLPTIFEWDESIKETYDHWQSGGMLSMNMQNILEENGAQVILDDYMFMLDTKKYQKDMVDLGYLNDTFRYSFFYNDLESEYGNSFYYYWFYGVNAVPFKLNVCPKAYMDSDTLYMMFDEDANLYLVSKEYFEQEVMRDE